MIELLIYNPFQRMIPHKSLWLAVRDYTVVIFFTLQTMKKRNALLVCN